MTLTQLLFVTLAINIFHSHTAFGASGFVKRKYYGARLEPVESVLHGAGQSGWQEVDRYRKALNGQYDPVIFMDYLDLPPENESKDYERKCYIWDSSLKKKGR